MDPMSALAIAAAVVQFADIGGRLLGRGWERFKHARDVSAELSSFAAQISSTSNAVREAAENPAATHNAASRTNLLSIAAECSQLASEFQKALDNMGRDSGTRSADMPFTPTLFQAFFHGDKIHEMTCALEALRPRVMEAVILCIW
jgi:hypothetical protein